MKKLFLDDIRVPFDCLKRIDQKQTIKYYSDENWEIVRDYKSFISYIDSNGLPDVISFDHDLAEIGENEKTGYDCAKWLCNYCAKNGLPIPEYYVHSMNPVGRNNIIQILSNYQKKWEESV